MLTKQQHHQTQELKEAINNYNALSAAIYRMKDLNYIAALIDLRAKLYREYKLTYGNAFINSLIDNEV